MSQYIKKMPKEPTFRKEGFDGYCYPLENTNISITLEDSFQKHDTYCTNVKKSSIYYVTSVTAHEINEHISIKSLRLLVEQYKELVEKICN